jgi:hypothetical protein
MSSDRELRDSIAAAGCLDSVLVWHGMVIDGRRRHEICLELGIVPPIAVLPTLQAACTALYLRHPDRAIVMAREHLGGHAGLPPTVRELADVCGTSVSAISLLVRPAKPKEKRGPHRTRSQRTELVRVWVEPQWLHYVRLAGASLGMNLSSTVRMACWEFVQRTLPHRPTEGTARSPSPAWVKKPERRLLKRSQ